MAVLTIIFLFFGCSGDYNVSEDKKDTKTDVLDKNNESKETENVLNIYSGIIKNANPLIINNNLNAQVLNLVYDSLIEYDQALNVKPLLAEAWEVSTDGSEWTIYLRNNVKWHDGNNLTSKDVEFTLNMLMTLGEESKYNYAVQNISSIEIKDDDTLTIKLFQPQFNYIKNLNFPILAAHKLIGLSNKEYFESNFPVVGTGQYFINKFIDMKERQLLFNKDSWRNGIPKIETINVKMIPDNQTALDSLKAGEVDFALTDDVDWGKYTSKGKYQISEFITTYFDLLAFNFNNEYLKDENIRKAIAYSINKEEIILKVLLEHAVNVEAPIVPGTYLFSPQNIYNYDPEKAKELLVNSGWIDTDGDNILEKEIDGVTNELTFNLYTNNENIIRTETIDIIGESLRKSGINVNVQKYSWDEFNGIVNSGNYDIALCGYNLLPSMDISFAFHTDEIERGTNIFRYSNIVKKYILFKKY
jgi:peptide/nickel transport system substrate-binding protein